jgi:hypothetical protein
MMSIPQARLAGLVPDKEQSPSVTAHRATHHGKQVKVNGHHWADAADEFKAKVIAMSLENYFHRPA